MKTISTGSIVIAAMAGLLAASCNKDTPNAGGSRREEVTVCANTTAAGRTSLSEGSAVNWEAGDQVAVLTTNDRIDAYELISPVALNSFEGESARITFEALVDYYPKHIVYPAANVTGYEQQSETFSIETPASFIPIKGGFPSGANMSLGTVREEGTMMKNLMGLVKFEITGSDIVSVSFYGNDNEKISGEMTLDPNTMKMTSGESALQSITLEKEEGETLEPGVYYIPTVPTEFKQGFSVKLINNAGLTAVKRYNTSYTLERNRIAYLGIQSDWGLEFMETTMTITCTFTDGVSEKTAGEMWNQAFNESIPTEALFDKAAGDPVGPYTLVGSADYHFYFRVQNFRADNSNYFRVTKAGLRMGGTLNDYILLPAIPGWKLTAVKLLIGNAKTEIAVTNNETDMDGNPTVTLGELKSVKGANDKPGTIEWALSNTTEGTAYRLNWSTGTPTSGIQQIKLTYEMAE